MVGLPKDSPTDNRTDPSAAEGSKYRLMLATLEPLLRLMENETSNPPALPQTALHLAVAILDEHQALVHAKSKI